MITKVAFQRLRRMSELSFLVAIQATMLFSCRADVGHRDRYLDSLFRVDEPVPRDFCLPFFYYLIIYVL